MLVNTHGKSDLLGFAHLMRMSMAGEDLTALGQALLERAAAHQDDACALLDAGLILEIKGNQQIGLSLQQEALRLCRDYRLSASTATPGLRLLVVMAPGELTANMPVGCLLEHSDVELHMHYLQPGAGFHVPQIAHDVLLVALSVSEANLPLLAQLQIHLADWPVPVINRPHLIPRVARDQAYALLHNIPGVLMPPTRRIDAQRMHSIARGALRIEDVLGMEWPVIVRPLDSHGGHDLEKISQPDQLAQYLTASNFADYFVSPFIDYRSHDGCYRKYRIALIGDNSFPCHMGISDHWMIHYLNAGMYENAEKRREEAHFMAAYEQEFGRRHQHALRTIKQRIGLDYFCLDCGETADGQLLIFEADHAAVIHAMDPPELFPYKQTEMKKVFAAFRQLLESAKRGVL